MHATSAVHILTCLAKVLHWPFSRKRSHCVLLSIQPDYLSAHGLDKHLGGRTGSFDLKTNSRASWLHAFTDIYGIRQTFFAHEEWTKWQYCYSSEQFEIKIRYLPLLWVHGCSSWRDVSYPSITCLRAPEVVWPLPNQRIISAIFFAQLCKRMLVTSTKKNWYVFITAELLTSWRETPPPSLQNICLVFTS